VSNALALGAVTAVLKDLLDNAIVDHSVSAAIGGNVTVSALPPDRIETGDNEAPRLNLFLYQVVPNPTLRNADLPTYDGRGRRVAKPVLALDLHYLLSAYSAQDFQSEILLGYAMQLLHERPMLTREAIRATLAAPSPVDGGILPPALNALSAARLADQLETIKLTPLTMNTEELSKLWTAFQAKYRPSVAYLATVVLVESELPALAALPVLSRGPVDLATGRDQGVIAQASLVPPYPALLSAAPATGQIAVRMGELLTITGRSLEGDAVFARFTHVRSRDVMDLVPEGGGDASGFDVRIPPDPPIAPVPPGSPLNPARWLAGVYAVAVVIQRAGETERVTNAFPVVLAPRVAGLGAAAGPAGVTVTLTVSPPVRVNQTVRLLVGTVEAGPVPFVGPSVVGLSFTSDSFPAGAQWVRLRVDEAESLLVDRAVKPPVFDPSQQVNVP
jgi:hypothetical protein